MTFRPSCNDSDINKVDTNLYFWRLIAYFWGLIAYFLSVAKLDMNFTDFCVHSFCGHYPAFRL